MRRISNSDKLIIVSVFIMSAVLGFIIARMVWEEGRKSCDCTQHLVYIRQLEDYILKGGK